VALMTVEQSKALSKDILWREVKLGGPDAYFALRDLAEWSNRDTKMRQWLTDLIRNYQAVNHLQVSLHNKGIFLQNEQIQWGMNLVVRILDKITPVKLHQLRCVTIASEGLALGIDFVAEAFAETLCSTMGAPDLDNILELTTQYTNLVIEFAKLVISWSKM